MKVEFTMNSYLDFEIVILWVMWKNPCLWSFRQSLNLSVIVQLTLYWFTRKILQINSITRFFLGKSKCNPLPMVINSHRVFPKEVNVHEKPEIFTITLDNFCCFFFSKCVLKGNWHVYTGRQPFLIWLRLSVSIKLGSQVTSQPSTRTLNVCVSERIARVNSPTLE